MCARGSEGKKNTLSGDAEGRRAEALGDDDAPQRRAGLAALREMPGVGRAAESQVFLLLQQGATKRAF